MEVAPGTSPVPHRPRHTQRPFLTRLNVRLCCRPLTLPVTSGAAFPHRGALSPDNLYLFVTSTPQQPPALKSRAAGEGIFAKEVAPGGCPPCGTKRKLKSPVPGRSGMRTGFRWGRVTLLTASQSSGLHVPVSTALAFRFPPARFSGPQSRGRDAHLQLPPGPRAAPGATSVSPPGPEGSTAVCEPGPRVHPRTGRRMEPGRPVAAPVRVLRGMAQWG